MERFMKGKLSSIAIVELQESANTFFGFDITFDIPQLPQPETEWYYQAPDGYAPDGNEARYSRRTYCKDFLPNNTCLSKTSVFH